MTSETIPVEEKHPRAKTVHRGSASEAVYAFGLFGAWFYYLSTATSFGMVLLGILKGFVWPAILVYEILKYLQM